MRRSSLARCMAIVLGFATAVATPAMAVIHGHEHGEMAEHASSSHHADVAVSPVDHELHGHATVTAGVASRWRAQTFAPPVSVVSLSLESEFPSQERAVVPSAQAPPHAAEFRPTPTRAPPANR